MTVVTDITKLSQTASLNGPDGAVDPPNVLDDQDRYLGSFIAMLRDGVGFTAGALTNPTGALGFTPVRQGTGPGQGTNVVSIGWSASLGKLLASVDNNAFGNVWPIDDDAALALRSGGVNTGTRMQFTWTDPGAGGGYAWCGDGAASQFVRPLSGMTVGRATTAGSADSTGYASNAGMVNSIGPWRYTNLNYNPPYLWATAGAPSDNFLVQPANLSVAYATSAGSAGSAPANGGTADNANALLGQGSAYWINNGSTAVRNLRNNGTAQLLAALSGFGDTWWATNPSDARLKKDIALTRRTRFHRSRVSSFANSVSSTTCHGKPARTILRSIPTLL